LNLLALTSTSPGFDPPFSSRLFRSTARGYEGDGLAVSGRCGRVDRNHDPYQLGHIFVCGPSRLLYAFAAPKGARNIVEDLRLELLPAEPAALIPPDDLLQERRREVRPVFVLRLIRPFSIGRLACSRLPKSPHSLRVLGVPFSRILSQATPMNSRPYGGSVTIASTGPSADISATQSPWSTVAAPIWTGFGIGTLA
jgi:hypothetical protein